MYVKEINKLINKVKNDKKILKCGNYKYNYSLALSQDKEGYFYYCYKGEIIFKFNDKKLNEKGLRVYLNKNDLINNVILSNIKDNKRKRYKKLKCIPETKDIKKGSKKIETMSIFVIDKKNRVAVQSEHLISVYKVLGEDVRIYYRRQKDPVRIKSNRGYALLYGVYLLNDEYFL